MDIKEALKNHQHTHYGFDTDIRNVLINFSTKDLIDYYINEIKSEGILRYYLEENIIADEKNKHIDELLLVLAPS